MIGVTLPSRKKLYSLVLDVTKMLPSQFKNELSIFQKNENTENTIAISPLVREAVKNSPRDSIASGKCRGFQIIYDPMFLKSTSPHLEAAPIL